MSAFGKFIIECNPEFFDDAMVAINQMLDEPGQKEMMSSATYSDGTEVHMFVRRLKRSISVKQVKP